jgi:peptide/nickel transport system permease protein
MLRLVLRRLGYLVLTMLAASLILFGLFELSPESVAVDALGQFSSAEQRALWLTQHGYDRPAAIRYFAWLGNFVTGDLGMSRIFNAPVAKVLLDRLGNTAILACWFFATLVPLSIGLGVLAGIRAGTVVDRAISLFCVITTSIPPFASTVLLSTIFVFWLHWLPGTSGMIDGFSYRELVMPVAALVLYDLGYVARMTRASMIDVMSRPYIRTAILKGVPYRRVILRHALRNALITPFTVIMLHVNWLIGGVIVVELFFAYKGFGSLILQATLSRDLFLLEACTMTAVVIAVTTQSFSDLAYTFLNPRIRFK